jgi:hypothetical protein
MFLTIFSFLSFSFFSSFSFFTVRKGERELPVIRNCTNVGPIYRLQIGTRPVFVIKSDRWNFKLQLYLLAVALNNKPIKNTAAVFLLVGEKALHTRSLHEP